MGLDQQAGGADRRRVVLVDHDPRWLEQARHEIQRLMNGLPGIIQEVHHIGSTAIPGLRAKPILDFVLGISSLAEVDDQAAAFDALGYIPRGENGIPGRRYFTRDSSGERTHHLHAFESGHSEIARMLNFRDLLRQHPGLITAYQELKENLVTKYRDDSVRYAEAKNEFISSVVAKQIEKSGEQA